MPTFQQYAEVNMIFGLLPYMAVLAGIMFYGSNFNRLFPINLGLPLLGLGFVCFALFKGSLWSYYLVDTLILAAIALLDVFLWTSIGDFGKVTGEPFKTFGIALALNLLGLFVGGSVGVRLMNLQPQHPELVGLIASVTIFASLMLAPLVLRQIDEKLQPLVDATEVTSQAQPKSTDLIRDLVPHADQLTDREIEIVNLILGGQATYRWRRLCLLVKIRLKFTLRISIAN